MIVTCERCTTQFQLDDARIPPGGVRVRCSRCKHAFEIERPDAEAPPDELGDTRPDLPTGVQAGGEAWDASDPPDAVLGEDPVARPGSPFAQRSALSGPASPSLPDEDEESSLLDDDDEPSQLDQPSADLASSPRAGGGSDEEESDWEFNEDPPSDPDPAASSGSETVDVVDQFLRSPRTSPGGADATPREELAEAPSGLDLADARGAISALHEPPRERRVPAAKAPAPEAPSAWDVEPAGAGDELGGADDWDLFGGEGSPGVRAPAVRLPSPVAGDDEEIAAPRWAGHLSRAGGLVGWLAVGALLAVGGLGALAPAATTAVEGMRVGSSGELEVVEASGVWIDNAVAGPIYVISGQLRNTGASRIPAPALAVELIDERGDIVADLPVPLEAPHSRRSLRELAPQELVRGRAPGADGAIAPGASAPFQAVVGAVPRHTAGYRVVEAPPSLRRRAPAGPDSERPAPKRKRRDSEFEMIAGSDDESPDAGSADDEPTTGAPASLAP